MQQKQTDLHQHTNGAKEENDQYQAPKKIDLLAPQTIFRKEAQDYYMGGRKENSSSFFMTVHFPYLLWLLLTLLLLSIVFLAVFLLYNGVPLLDVAQLNMAH